MLLVYQHRGVDDSPIKSTTYQRNQHITILCAVLRVIGGPTGGLFLYFLSWSKVFLSVYVLSLHMHLSDYVLPSRFSLPKIALEKYILTSIEHALKHLHYEAELDVYLIYKTLY